MWNTAGWTSLTMERGAFHVRPNWERTCPVTVSGGGKRWSLDGQQYEQWSDISPFYYAVSVGQFTANWLWALYPWSEWKMTKSIKVLMAQLGLTLSLDWSVVKKRWEATTPWPSLSLAISISFSLPSFLLPLFPFCLSLAFEALPLSVSSSPLRIK